MQKTYYKVVIVDKSENRVSFSSSHFDFPSAFKVIYEPDKEVSPTVKGAKLFVFDDFDSAFTFTHLWDHFRTKAELWECEVTNPQTPPIKISYYSSIEKYWLDKSISPLLLMPVPKNTVLVDSVKLTKLLETSIVRES